MGIGKKVAHNTFIQIAGKAFSVTIAIGAMAILTRYLGQEQFGWYTTTVAFLQFFGILADFGLVLVTAQMLASNPGKEKKIMHNLFTFRLFSAIIIIGLAPLTVLFFPYPEQVKVAVGISTIMFISIAMQQIFTGLFQKHLEMKWTVLAEILARITLISGVGLVAWYNLGFLAAISAMVIASLVHLAALWSTGARFQHIRLAFDKAIWKEIIGKSWPIALSIFFNMVYLRADILILSLTRTQAEVGLYGAAYRILDTVLQAPIMFMGIVLPILTAAWVQKNRDYFKRVLARANDFFILFGLPLIVGGIILAVPILTFIAGDEFVQSGFIAQILFLALIGGFMGALYGHTIVAINKQRKAIWIYFWVALLGLIAYLLVIPMYGTIGAAWVTVATELVAGVLLYNFIRRTTKTSIPFGVFGSKVLIATSLMGLAVWFLRDINLGFVLITGILVYSIAILLLKAVTIKEIRSLIR